ncbi:MAG: autotransporter outer membrane beta-barrel domain-containing protein, partial [Akkermansia sp.]|nr:autotransporter outer membrane beta-barrel domain-containing protein [Akkermansia sp.]
QGAGATVTQQGGTLTVDDAVTVTTTGGTINLEGGALNGTVSGATINATSGALNATLNGENALHGNNYALQGEIANNGTLTVSGTFDASALQLDTEAATHIDVNGQSGASGFAKDASYSVAIFSGTVVNDGATVTHGTHTLELGADGVAKAGGEIDYSDYLLTGSDTASTSDIHIIGPGATVTQQGGTLTVDDAVTVATTGGTINLEGGALNGTVSGATINAGAGELNAILSGSNTLYGENYLLTGALNNTGTLILEGTFELSTQLPEDVHQATHIDVNGQSGASGFAKAEQHDITIAIGGDIITDDAIFTRGGKILTPGEGGKVISGGEIDYSNYLLTGTDTAATSAIHAIGPDATVTQTGGTLTVDDTVTVATTAGTITLAGGTLNGAVSGATINATSGALNAALTGSNTLHGVNYVLRDVISNSGTLTVSGTFDASALQLDTTETTHIDVYGQSGASGFAKAVGYSVAVVNGGSVVNDGAEITHGSISLTLGTDGVATAGGEIDYGTYYLHDGAEVAVSAIRTVPEAAVATVDMDGGLLEADADVEVDSTGGRIEVSQDARVSGSIHDTQVAIRGCEISADITGGSTVTVEGETILSGHNTYTGDTDVMDGGMLKVTGSIISDVHLHGGIMDTAAGMALVDGQDVVFTGGNVRGNLRTVAGSGLNLEQNGLVDGDLTLGGGTLKLGDGCVLSVSGSLTLDAATTLVGDWQADEVYTLIVTGGVQDESGTASLNEFFRVSDELGTVRMEGNTILLDTHTHHTADAMDTTLVDSLWASSSYIREFARLAEGQSYAVRRGETAVWGGGFGSFMNVSGNDGFTADGAGYAFGVNHAFSTNMQAGVGLGQSFGSYHNKALTGAKVHQKGMMAAATAQYLSAKGGSFMLSGHAAVGRVRNNADTYLGGLAGKSRWDDTMLSLGARASYAMHVTVDTVIAPFIGMEWMYGSQESFSDSHGRRYSNGKLSELRMPVGVTLRSSTTIGSDTRLLPELSVAFVPSLVQHNPHADTTVQGGSYRTEGYDPGRHGFMLNAGMNVLFSESWSAGAFYTLETRKHAVNQSVNASLQYRF